DAERLAAEEANPETRNDLIVLDNYFIAYHRNVFEALSDRQLPESDDELPTWFASAELGRHLLVHWRNVPLAPSSMPPQGR
ncbi:MAG TPA: hypothetical protein VI541_02255, partial [Actinomycetota bacterium]|nr:hypothetical protein [Actinomycetota bacterium]